MNAKLGQSNAERLGTPAVRQSILLLRWVNEPFPLWDQILTAHEVARLARRPPWFVRGMAVMGRFPRKRRFRGCGIGWLRSDAGSGLPRSREKTIFDDIDRSILSRLLAERGRFRVCLSMVIQQESYEIGAPADALVPAMSEAHGRPQTLAEEYVQRYGRAAANWC
jgi:hypothetical protein